MTTEYDSQEIKTSQPLKPCPFCGGDVGMIYVPPHTHTTLAGHMPDHPGSVHIECVTCEYAMHGPDEATLTARWNGRADDPDEAYEIGKHEGYERAVQVIDIATGGDGEYKGSTIPGETVDSDVMQARIIERCKRADVAEEALAALKGMVDAVAMGPLDVAAKYGPDAHPDEAVIDATFRAKDVIAKLEAS